MLIRLGLMLVLVSFLACSDQKAVAKTPSKNSDRGTKLSNLDWMLGKWKRQDTGELALWSKREDSYFGGMMVKINQNQKAVIQEVLSLEGRKDGIYFSAKEKGQNNRHKVEYKMSNKNFDAPKFSSSSINSPQHISYLKIGRDKIKVEEMGTSGDGKSYYYVREM